MHSPCGGAVGPAFVRSPEARSSETDSGVRMQCKRDAQVEYDKAAAAAKSKMTAAGHPVPAAPACADCGKVISVKQVEQKGEGSAVGLVGGALLVWSMVSLFSNVDGAINDIWGVRRRRRLRWLPFTGGEDQPERADPSADQRTTLELSETSAAFRQALLRLPDRHRGG